jgi:hexulose-6-phosphate isomerase
MRTLQQSSINEGRIYKACKWGMIHGAASAAERFQLCKAVGFDGMEPVSPLEACVVEIRQASAATGLPVHGMVNQRVNRLYRLGSPDEATRAEGRRLLARSLRECHACGGDSVLWIPGRVGPDGTHDDVWRRSIEEVRRVLPLASKLGVRLLVENVWNKFCQNPEQMRDYLDEIDSPWVGAYFDIGNARKFAPSEAWIRTLGRRIVKVDVKDWSESRGLCTIGEGVVNWPAVCDALGEAGFSGWATAEVKGGRRKELAEIAQQMDRVLQIR